MTNPLLEQHKLPPFELIKADQIVTAITELTTGCLSQIDALVANIAEPTESNFLRPLEAIQDKLNQNWSPVSHLANVMDSPEFRDAYKDALALKSDYGTRMGQHQGLYQTYQKLDQNSLSSDQKKAVENALLSFKLSGIGLPEAQRKRFAEIQQELSELSNKFQDNVLDATQGWTKLIKNVSELEGLPNSTLSILSQAALDRDMEGWLVTLEAPSYLAIMTYADNRELRKEVATAFVTRASDQGPTAGQWDNGPIIEKVLSLKSEKAALLDYKNFAEVSLAQKMAESPEQVLEFLNNLASRSFPQAQKEFSELQDYAKTNLDLDKVQPWDLAWVGEKLREHQYAISQEMIRPYLPVEKTLAGLFEVCNRLFGVQFKINPDVKTYHQDAHYYDVLLDGQTIAGFYLDLYARVGKRGGAWMDDCRVRRQTEQGIQLPVAYLNCNFSAPIGDQPSMLTHNELTTLFHEFGHGIHHMLTRIDVADVSGINGVAWDAVELPSQFMENFCWQPEALEFISGHIETGKPIPKALLDKMLAAKNFQSAMMSVRQLEFSLFDFELHCKSEKLDISQVRECLNSVRERVTVVPIIPENRFENGFSHIFGGGYAAGYYSYKWAEVLSADAFSRFEEEGVFNPETGKAFYDSILTQGGSKDAMDLFKAFRGREPTIDALLRHTGILEI